MQRSPSPWQVRSQHPHAARPLVSPPGEPPQASAACIDEQRVCLNADCTEYAGEFHFPNFGIPRYGDYTIVEVSDFKHDKSNFEQVNEWRSDSLTLYDDDGDKGGRKNEGDPVEGEKYYHKYDPSNPYADPIPSAFVYTEAMTGVGAKIGHFRKDIVANEDKMTVGKRQCEVRYFFGVMDFIMMIFVALVLAALGKTQDQEAEDLDEAEQTAQDYSVVIEDPNADETDPDTWKVRGRPRQPQLPPWRGARESVRVNAQACGVFVCVCVRCARGHEVVRPPLGSCSAEGARHLG